MGSIPAQGNDLFPSNNKKGGVKPHSHITQFFENWIVCWELPFEKIIKQKKTYFVKYKKIFSFSTYINYTLVEVLNLNGVLKGKKDLLLDFLSSGGAVGV